MYKWIYGGAATLLVALAVVVVLAARHPGGVLYAAPAEDTVTVELKDELLTAVKAMYRSAEEGDRYQYLEHIHPGSPEYSWVESSCDELLAAEPRFEVLSSELISDGEVEPRLRVTVQSDYYGPSPWPNNQSHVIHHLRKYDDQWLIWRSVWDGSVPR
jgi:hypothetical protein